MRTGYISLVLFLYKMQVLGIETARYRCNASIKTIRHIVEECLLEDRRRLGARKAPNLRRLLLEKGKTKGVAKWFIGTRRLR